MLTGQLGKKMLVIACIPLVSSTIFIALLGYLLSEEERARDREQAIREKVEIFADIQRQLTQIVVGVGLYMKNPEEHMAKALALKEQALKDDLNTLKGKCANNWREAQDVREASEGLVAFMDKIHEAMHLCEVGMDLAPIRLMELKDEITPALETYQNRYMQFKKLLAAEAERNPHSARSYRWLLKIVVVAGLVVAILITIGMARLLSRQIVERLQVLRENSLRLKTEQELLPPLPDGDEIAELDQSFRGMASALAESMQQIKTSETRVRLMMERMPAGLLLVDSTGLVAFVNPKAETIFQTAGQDLLNQSFANLFAAGTAQTSEEFIRALQQRTRGRSVTLEPIWRPDTAEEKPTMQLEISVDEIAMSEGTGFLVILMDVSEKAELQRVRRQFSAMIAHDLATPLTSLELLFSTLAAGVFGNLSADGTRAVARAQIETKRMVNLLKDWLKVEKYSETGFEIAVQRFDLIALLEHCTASMLPQAKDKNVAIILSGDTTDDCDLEVLADPDRLTQVFVNLLSNAVKYSPEGRQVELMVRRKEAKAVEISVRDQGPGIPTEAADKLFKPFSQSRSSDETKKGGTGLGLAICRAIVEAHGGTIIWQNQNNGGTAFIVRLPILIDAT